jgi:uncharacterized membrane protein
MNLSEPLRLIAQAIATLVEGVGVAIVALAIVVAAVCYLTDLTARRRTLPSDAVRLGLGRSLALSLEFLLGADILRTAVEPSWDEIGRLAAIAAIRTALNFFLQREIAGEATMAAAAAALERTDGTARGVGPAGADRMLEVQPGLSGAGRNRSHGQGLPA